MLVRVALLMALVCLASAAAPLRVAAADTPPPPAACAAYDISPPRQKQRQAAAPATVSYPEPKPFRDCPDCPSMVWIPDQAFAVSQTEVTFAEWNACLADGGCDGHKPDNEGWGGWIESEYASLPVINVTWHHAQAYARWLSEKTGHRYRLLTTDEWTIAAFPGGRVQLYPWGNETPVCEKGARNGVAYHDECWPEGPMQVGSFQPNAFGLYDMIGNVGEWLEDPYRPGDARRAIIGSSWRSDLKSLGGRGGAKPHEHGDDTGIRVARER
jgi:formylglycine-generating enzyme required for sulfatase activity